MYLRHTHTPKRNHPVVCCLHHTYTQETRLCGLFLCLACFFDFSAVHTMTSVKFDLQICQWTSPVVVLHRNNLGKNATQTPSSPLPLKFLVCTRLLRLQLLLVLLLSSIKKSFPSFVHLVNESARRCRISAVRSLQPLSDRQNYYFLPGTHS